MEIHARGFGEILTVGMGYLGKVWRKLIPPSFGAFVVLGAATILIFRATGANEVLDLIFTNPEALETMTDEEILEFGRQIFSAIGWAVVLQLIASGYVALAVHRLVAAEIAGNPISAGEAARFAFTRLAPLLVAGLIGAIGIFFGLLLLIVPGVWLAGSLAMTAPAMAIEGLGPTDALRRSYHLVRGRWFPTVGFMLMVGLLGMVAGQFVQLVGVPLFTVGSLGIGLGLAFVLSVVIQGFIVAAIAVMSTAWYVDLRARKEILLSESLG